MADTSESLKAYHVYTTEAGNQELVGHYDDLVKAQELADLIVGGEVLDNQLTVVYTSEEDEPDYEIKHDTREGWLNALVAKMRPTFDAAGEKLPEKVTMSPGYPPKGGLAEKNKVLGACMFSEDGSAHIFMNPEYDIPQEVFEVVSHELVHAALGPDEAREKGGHTDAFKALGLKVGLEGRPAKMKPKQQVIDDFTKHWLPELGWYPHTRLEPQVKPKKQSTRMLKVWCDGNETVEGELRTTMAHEEYTLRGAKKQLDRGVPVCPVCGLDMMVDWPKKGEEE
jgi:hypothetical protein